MKRRQVLIRGMGLAGACVLGVTTGNAAAGKSSKASLLYQDRPHDGKRCCDCKFFSGNGNSNTGICAIVEGVIDCNGWCTAFSPKA